MKLKTQKNCLHVVIVAMYTFVFVTMYMRRGFQKESLIVAVVSTICWMVVNEATYRSTVKTMKAISDIKEGK